ncbi:MAG: hypothetical protein WKF62_03785 [Solirubrobacterales bacterium]
MTKDTLKSQIKRPLALAGALALVGGAAIATGAIPNSATDEVHLCFQKRAATSERGGAEVRLYDDELNPGACLKGDRELVMNQRGPQGEPGQDGTDGMDGEDGATGPQGPAGTAGPAYSASLAGEVSVFNLAPVISKTVPAGSYVINASLTLRNWDDDDVATGVYCLLRAGGTSLQRAPAESTLDERGAIGYEEAVALQGTVSNFGGGQLDVSCELPLAADSDEVRATQPVITAIRVGQINPP